jgi:uncharacterized protein YggT (Ycf19 family)
MIFITNLLNLPFLVLIWLIEAYFLLTTARLIIATIPSANQSHFFQQLKLLTDPVPNIIRRGWARWRNEPLPSWAAWVIVILLGCIVRQIVISVLVSQSFPVQ